MKYVFSYPEVYYNIFEVEAASYTEAQAMVDTGEVEVGETEYSHPSTEVPIIERRDDEGNYSLLVNGSNPEKWNSYAG